MSAPPAANPSAPSGAAQARHRRHWRNTRLITAALLCGWLGATFGIGFFARDLDHIRFFGWPLSYYMGAQGSLILFLLIIGGYALAMRRLDRAAAGAAETP